MAEPVAVVVGICILLWRASRGVRLADGAGAAYGSAPRSESWIWRAVAGVTVLEEECEDRGGFWSSCESAVKGDGALGELSGFAMRRPPRACVRLRSLLMLGDKQKAALEAEQPSFLEPRQVSGGRELGGSRAGFRAGKGHQGGAVKEQEERESKTEAEGDGTVLTAMGKRADGGGD